MKSANPTLAEDLFLGKEILKAIYLNENDVLPHIGCKAVANAHHLLFERLGIQLLHTFYKNDLWCYKKYTTHEERVSVISSRYHGLFSEIDALIINAEGTLHHGRGEDLLAMVDAAIQNGVKVYIINALIQEMGEYAEVLAKCSAIVTRDPRSFAEAKKYSDSVYLTPDTFVIADFEPAVETEVSDKIIVTDYLGTMPEGPGYIVDRLIKDKAEESEFFPLQSPFTSSQWRGVVNRLRSARCVVSARHHGLYAAAMAGRPMVILESNSHKMAAFREMYGEFIPIVSSYDQIDKAIEAACSAEEKFKALPQKFHDYDTLGTYATAFGRSLKNLSEYEVTAISARPSGPKGAFVPVAQVKKSKIKAVQPVKVAEVASSSWFERTSQKGMKIIKGRVPESPTQISSLAPSSPVVEQHAVVALEPWKLNYCEDLADARRRRDPRLLPLRSVINSIASEAGTYRQYRSFWDLLIRYGRSRHFINDELAATVVQQKDPDLLAKISASAGRFQPDAGYYAVTLGVLKVGVPNPTPRFRITMAHICNALRAESYAECAVLLESIGQLNKKLQTIFVNTLIPVLAELQDFKQLLTLVDVYSEADIKERNLLKVANAHFMLGRYVEAKSMLALVTEDETLRTIADHRRGRIMIHLGEFKQGWPLMNRVVDREHFTKVANLIDLPMWTPTATGIKRIVVWFHELGGIGEEILWGQLLCRFKAKVNCNLRLVVDPRLTVLFEQSFPDCEVVSRSASFEEIRKNTDAFIFSRELTQFDISKEQDFVGIANHQYRLPVLPKAGTLTASVVKNIAISWKTTNAVSAAYRNVPLHEFAQLLSGYSCNFHCLQHGDIREDLAVLQAELGDRLHTSTFDPTSSVEEMGEGLQRMDGVITIDNTTLHIAGALGVPVLALISIPAYWQWPASGSWSRWYDSVSLLRQDAPGHWASVFAALEERLSTIIEKKVE